ncbi:(2Fe-2S) ferredoxin domain-containing protein [Ktedonobacter sp. SOSP1-85]|uniref:(2Fe-2S) ferredoxin domain-containing protein n=1 Tax=Ktedonobacter sp. SOSP1-85 TaxID=2778367 RepID=UPI001F3DB2E7|nr:(2Fe-2S) ferredoxin domain-containing protein [Ktedonobacter sp. SOSP1-85]
MKNTLVVREDGKLIKVVQKRGHLFVCAHGCCCGKTERDFAPVPEELYHHEWERRRLRNKVHLTFSACLGPCSLANVALLIFDGTTTWFHSLNTAEQILALYEYIEKRLLGDAPLPKDLQECVFDGFSPAEVDTSLLPLAD